jgi:pantetheine-phosphate adenylyltransferase
MRLAIYPGSFDPPTLGHLDLIERAAKLFDGVIVAVGVNRGKSPFMGVEERLEALRAATAHIPNVDVRSFTGLLIHAAGDWGVNAVVRGLRATADFDFEFQSAMANRRLDPNIETVFLMTIWEHSFISSSVVREIALMGGDYSQLVPAPVARFIAARLER